MKMGDVDYVHIKDIPSTFTDIMSPKDVFSLVGLIRFKGTRKSNLMDHYTAVCLRQNTWIEYNDLDNTKIFKLTKSTKICPEILVYARIDA